ncbi:hypothetical protein [Auritidibacter ignavus]|uniref:hypothetical protein n=1 Tax=Auritidibacter ignavus TaxID=678932 RepID=UPI002FE50726
MSWLKTSDAAAYHPIVLAPLSWDKADARTVNELFGWVMRCAVQSAQHNEDYLVSIGTARATAGSFDRYEALVEAGLYAGYLKVVDRTLEDGTVRQYLKLAEEEDLFHMFLKSERDWQAARKRDNNNEALTAPVRARDGDACRWCGKIVFFPEGAGGDQKSARRGTLDHLFPGTPARSPEDMVVSCKACNSARKDDPDGQWIHTKLLGVPMNPYYSKNTAKFLTECGYEVKASEKRPVTIPAEKRFPVQVPEPVAGQVEHPDSGSGDHALVAPGDGPVVDGGHPGRGAGDDNHGVEPRGNQSQVDLPGDPSQRQSSGDHHQADPGHGRPTNETVTHLAAKSSVEHGSISQLDSALEDPSPSEVVTDSTDIQDTAGPVEHGSISQLDSALAAGPENRRIHWDPGDQNAINDRSLIGFDRVATGSMIVGSGRDGPGWSGRPPDSGVDNSSKGSSVQGRSVSNSGSSVRGSGRRSRRRRRS